MDSQRSSVAYTGAYMATSIKYGMPDAIHHIDHTNTKVVVDSKQQHWLPNPTRPSLHSQPPPPPPPPPPSHPIPKPIAIALPIRDMKWGDVIRDQPVEFLGNPVSVQTATEPSKKKPKPKNPSTTLNYSRLVKLMNTTVKLQLTVPKKGGPAGPNPSSRNGVVGPHDLQNVIAHLRQLGAPVSSNAGGLTPSQRDRRLALYSKTILSPEELKEREELDMRLQQHRGSLPQPTVDARDARAFLKLFNGKSWRIAVRRLDEEYKATNIATQTVRYSGPRITGDQVARQEYAAAKRKTQTDRLEAKQVAMLRDAREAEKERQDAYLSSRLSSMPLAGATGMWSAGRPECKMSEIAPTIRATVAPTGFAIQVITGSDSSDEECMEVEEYCADSSSEGE